MKKYSRLERLAKLHDSGVLNEDEFQGPKRKDSEQSINFLFLCEDDRQAVLSATLGILKSTGEGS